MKTLDATWCGLQNFKHTGYDVDVDEDISDSPRSFIQVLLEKLTGREGKDWQRAREQLERELFEEDLFEQPVVVVVDDLDALVTQEKSVNR